MTANHEANALIALHLTEEFGRREVYRVRSTPRRASDGGGIDDRASRGRPLFDSACTYDVLNRRLREGWVIKATRLSDEFDFEALQKHYNGDVIVLGVMRRDGRLVFDTDDVTLGPEPGQTVIAMVRDRGADEQADEAPTVSSDRPAEGQ
jgi:hypothetical protein